MTTSAQRQAKLRKTRRKRGMVRVEVWTIPKWVERIKEFVAKLNRGE